MKNYFLFKIFKTKPCLIIFFLGLILGYLIIPKTIFSGFWTLIRITYIILFSIVITCIVRVIKERIINMKQTGAGIISIIAAALGLGAMQVCGVGAPICGATIGVGIISIFFPSISLNFLSHYSLLIIFISMVLEIIAIYYMGCLKKCIKQNNETK